MAKKTNLKKAEEIVEELGMDEYSLFDGYSGRFMYGEKCIGIVGPNANRIIEVASRKGFKGAKTDNMGLDFIVYWPNLR